MQFTDVQKIVVALFMNGLRPVEIAKCMDISRAGAADHFTSLYRKFGISGTPGFKMLRLKEKLERMDHIADVRAEGEALYQARLWVREQRLGGAGDVLLS